MKSAVKTKTTKSDVRLREDGAEFTYDSTQPFSNATIRCKGKTLSLKEWSAQLGGKYSLVRDRLVQGWTFSEAVTCKLRARRTKDSMYTGVIAAVLPKLGSK